MPPCTGSEEKLDLELSGDCSPEAVLASSPREKLQHDLNTFTPTSQRLRVVGPDAHGGVEAMARPAQGAWAAAVVRPARIRIFGRLRPRDEL